MKNVIELVNKAHAQSAKSGFWNHDKGCLHGGCGELIEAGVSSRVKCSSLEMHSNHDAGAAPGPCLCANRDIYMKLSLINSEIAEVLEEYRLGEVKHGGPFYTLLFESCLRGDSPHDNKRDRMSYAQFALPGVEGNHGHNSERVNCSTAMSGPCSKMFEEHKPVGFMAELADICIRVFDLAGHLEMGEAVEGELVEFDADYDPEIAEASFGKLLWICSAATTSFGNDQADSAFLAVLLFVTQFIAGKFSGDLDAAIEIKMAYNATRAFMHGKTC